MRNLKSLVDKTIAEHSTGLWCQLIKGSLSSLGLQFFFAGISFLNTFIFARLLGTNGYGAFANANAWVNIFLIPTTFGFGTLLVREVAIYRASQQWEYLKGIIHFAVRFVLVAAIPITSLYFLITRSIFSSHSDQLMRYTLWIAMPGIILLSLVDVLQGATRGLERIIYAKIPGLIVRPSLLLLVTLGIFFLQPNWLSAPIVMIVNMFVATIAVGTAFWGLRDSLHPTVRQVKPKYKTKKWLCSSFSLMMYSGLQIGMGQMDIVMVGSMLNADDVGLYSASSRLAFLPVFVMNAIDYVSAPMMARLYEEKEHARLQTLLTRTVRISFLSVLPFGLILIFGGRYLLGIFGKQFEAAQATLTILVVGCLIHVALGSGNLLLSMSGHEQVVAVVMVLGIVANLLVNAILIPLYKIEGAAIGSAFSIILIRVIYSIIAVKKTGKHVAVIG